MALSEEARHALHNKLDVVLGPAEATTLMEHLPPVGWADVATKHDLDAHQIATKRDLDALSERMDARFATVDVRFATVEQTLADHGRRLDNVESEVKALRTDMTSGFESLRSELRDDREKTATQFASVAKEMAGIKDAVGQEMRRYFVMFVTTCVALVGAISASIIVTALSR